jgi:predicted lipoprotein with Yx(FWY)xxD motif
MKTTKIAAILLLSAFLSACATYGHHQTGPAKAADGVLAGANGMTLYTFDKDAAGSGKSVCNGPCAANWPPLLVKEGEAAHGDYSVVTRDDGARQWAFKGRPLYFWVKDQKPGDRTGDGFNNVWHVAKP